MRATIILPLATLALAGCQVSTDDANDSTTVQYNQDIAENVAGDVSNEAGAIAGLLGDRQRAETIGHAARRRMVEAYRWDARLAPLAAIAGLEPRQAAA